MKKMTLGFAVIMTIVFAGVHGWAQTSSNTSADDAAGTSSKINDLFSTFTQKVHSQIHNLTNDCMSNVTKIPSDQKIIWCQEIKQKKIDQMKQIVDRSGQTNIYWNQQLEQLQDDLDRCQYIADGMLIDRCSSFEKNINANIQRFSDPNT